MKQWRRQFLWRQLCWGDKYVGPTYSNRAIYCHDSARALRPGMAALCTGSVVVDYE